MMRSEPQPSRHDSARRTGYPSRLSLDGEWVARMCEPGVGEAKGWQDGGFERELTALIPGQLQNDLVREAMMPDFNYAENAKEFRRLEGKDWWLARSFELAETTNRSELYFGGIDTEADAWLNGVYLGHHSSAHLSWTIDSTEAVRPGENTLVVRVDDGSRWAEGRETGRYTGLDDEMMAGSESRMWVRKPQYVWRWDWSPRLLTCGIWRSIELRGYQAVALRDVCMASTLHEGGSATVEAGVELEWFGPAAQIELSVSLHKGGESHRATASVAVEPGRQSTTLVLELEEPQLWWPAPLGEPALYECSVTVAGPGGSDRSDFRYGLRTIELTRPGLGEEGEGFTFLVNGVPIFCKGSCWNPPEHLFGCVSDAKLRTLIGMAATAGMNLIRVWGGGTFESDLFYDLCDEYGIMVWQDFPFACAYYPDDDEEFCAGIRDEAEDAIRRLRNHPSLTVWCGNNENEWLHELATDPDNPFGLVAAPEFYGGRLYHEVLPAVCAELDPGRPYIPSTPTSGPDQFPNAASSGCRHAWDYQFMRSPADRIYFEDIELDRSKFVSEFGFLGPSDTASLRRFLPDRELMPGSPAWSFHDNYFEEGTTGAAISRYWCDSTSLKVDDYVALGQMFQGIAFGNAVRSWRRRKFLTSGAVSWGFVDCWGTSTSWSLVDYYARPRAAFFHAKRAFEPLQVSLERNVDRFSVWVVNDFVACQEGTLEVGFKDLVGSHDLALDRLDFCAPPNSATLALELECPPEVRLDPARFVAHCHFAVEEHIVSRAHASLVGYQFNRLRLQEPSVTVDRDGQLLEIRAHSYTFQFHVSAPGNAIPDDNWFDLLPGERRTIALSGPEEAELSCWAFGPPQQSSGRVLVARLA